MLKAAIIGAGYIARSHADAYRAHQDVELSLIVDSLHAKAVALAAEFGGRAVGTVAEVLDSDVEVVSICTPTPTHVGLALRALSAGKSVLCEKPIANTLRDAARMVEVSQTASGLLMVGHVSRFEPDHRAARDIVLSGDIGSVRMMSQRLTSSMPSWSQNGWLGDSQQSGGPLVDLEIHSFDYLNWVSGSRPVRVHAVGSKGANGLIDCAVATVRYENGAMGMVETGWANPESQGLSVVTEIAGTQGRLGWDSDDLSVGTFHSRSGGVRHFSPLGNRGFRGEIAAFVGAVRDGSASPVSAAEAELALQVALAAVESIECGTVVTLPHREESR